MDSFIARQAILDRREDLFAYELLFRTSADNMFPRSADPDHASLKTIGDAFGQFGLTALSSGKPVFINLTRRVLLEGHLETIAPHAAYAEILENVPPDPEVIKACGRLKAAGYTIVLDDFVFTPGYEPLIELTDIIKVDFLQTRGDARRQVVEQFGAGGVRFLAEKVETREDAAQALKFGYDYLQGYFFCQPQVMVTTAIPEFKLNYLRLMAELNSAEFNYDRVERILKQEMSMTLKLLRYLNSATFAWGSKVTTIRQALIRLGELPFRKWASLAAVVCLGSDKPAELVRTSLLRANFCERLRAAGVRLPELDLFLTGLLSAVDALLDQPMAKILATTAVSPAVSAALLRNEGPLATAFQLALAFERAQWDHVNTLARSLQLDETKVPAIYLESVAWVDKAMTA